MDGFDRKNNKIFIGSSTSFLREISENTESQQKDIDRIRLLFKNYLELDNVNFLFGSGSSVNLGAVSVRNFPLEIEKKLKADEESYRLFSESADILAKPEDKGRTRGEDEELNIEFETFLNYLIAQSYVQKASMLDEANKTETLISLIKKGLFEVCNLENRKPTEEFVKRIGVNGFTTDKKINKYYSHEKFIKSLLKRPLSLRRANIFTLNYDLAFEYAFENLGVHYINGFTGFHKRYFRPETFEYDFYYPGSTTTGKVQRIEKVIKYFKLHGSLSWVQSESCDSENIFGIEEQPIKLVDESKSHAQILIYPTAVKKSYTLDFPYSELFRRFAASISQPQSVLFTVGYSFCDEHVNDIIYQSLSNPSFTLVILAFSPSKEINRLKLLNDPRIIILEGPFLGDFMVFADQLMPDFYDIDIRERIATTINKLYSANDNSAEESENKDE